jgi:hypothetical protein
MESSANDFHHNLLQNPLFDPQRFFPWSHFHTYFVDFSLRTVPAISKTEKEKKKENNY